MHLNRAQPSRNQNVARQQGGSRPSGASATEKPTRGTCVALLTFHALFFVSCILIAPEDRDPPWATPPAGFKARTCQAKHHKPRRREASTLFAFAGFNNRPARHVKCSGRGRKPARKSVVTPYKTSIRESNNKLDGHAHLPTLRTRKPRRRHTLFGVRPRTRTFGH